MILATEIVITVGLVGGLLFLIPYARRGLWYKSVVGRYLMGSTTALTAGQGIALTNLLRSRDVPLVAGLIVYSAMTGVSVGLAYLLHQTEDTINQEESS